MNNDILTKTVHELSDLLRSKKISSTELTKTCIEAADHRDKELNCYVTRCDESALKDAQRADERLARGEGVTALTGIPIALKDIFVTKGVRTTCCSKILCDYIPSYDGEAVARLKEAGVVLLGKLNMDEFAFGSSNEFSAFGPVKNPWNREYVPGGSSGGSASAVAAGLIPASLGTDTGGSIRQPAGFCGIVGLKPTYGRVSRYGIVAFASSLDQLGPMTRTALDSAIILKAVAGYDPKDSTSINAPVPDYPALLKGNVEGLTIGIPKEYFVSGIDPEVESAVRTVSGVLQKLGAKIKEISLPHTRHAVPCYYIIAPAEASSNLARYDGVRYGGRAKNAKDIDELFIKSRAEGFGHEVLLRIIVGTYVLSSGYYDAYYLKAQKARTLIKRDFLDAFNSCDAILTPVTPTPPFKIGEKTDDPVKMYLNDIFTIPVNLAGLPAISIPCGISKAGLPIGMQIIGRPLDESGILNVAHAYEQATEWHKRIPVS